MSKYRCSVAGLVGVLGGLGMMPAAAQMTAPSNQIVEFTGRILNQTCEIKEASRRLTVNLPHVRRGMLREKGQTAGEMAFQIELMHCTGGEDKPYLRFEPNGAVDMTTGNLMNAATNGAKDVQIQLLSASDMPIMLHQTMQAQPDMAQAAGNDGMVTLKYKVRYYAMGPVMAGDVQASVKYTIAYQ